MLFIFEYCLSFSANFSSAVVTEVSDARLAATASGPDGQTALVQKPGASTFSAHLTAAGTHSLAVCLEDIQTQQTVELQARTKLRGLTVVPGAVCPHRTTVQALPDRLVAGVGCDFTICPVDVYGNAGASGAGQYTLSCPVLYRQIPCLPVETLRKASHSTAMNVAPC